MFGYITIDKEELKLKHFKEYQSFYCGICNALRKRYGLFYTMFLNYEVVFLYLFLDAICCHRDKTRIDLRCPINPLMKKNNLFSNELLDYVCFVNVYLVIMKCRDDFKDDKNINKKLLEKIISRNIIYKENIIRYKDLIEKLDLIINDLNDFESNIEDTTFNQCSSTMGKFLSCVIMYYINLKREIKEETELRIIENISDHLGRWLYLIDAYDDFDKDKKENKFNLLNLIGEKSKDRNEIIQNAVSMLLLSTAFLNTQSKKIVFKNHNELIRNYFQYGFKAQVYKITNKHKYFQDKRREGEV